MWQCLHRRALLHCGGNLIDVSSHLTPRLQEYARAYATHFDLRPHIRFNCKLLRLRWCPNIRSWEALYCDTSVEKFYKVGVCVRRRAGMKPASGQGWRGVEVRPRKEGAYRQARPCS